MIIILKNYPSVVDAKAWVIRGEKDKLVHELEAMNEKLRASEEFSSTVGIPPSILNRPKQIIGVTFDDAEGAVKQMYDVNWSSLASYGDLVLLGNRHEMLMFQNGCYVYLWVKNDRGTQMSLLFDFKTYMNIDPNRKSHQKGKCIMNYCPPNIPQNIRDKNTITLISLIKDDEPLVESDVINLFISDANDLMFSAQI